MTRSKRVLAAGAIGVTLLVLTVVTASATGAGRGALRAAGTRAVLLSSTSVAHPQAARTVVTSPTFSPMDITIGERWTLHGRLLLSGTVTITCGPFLPSPSDFSNAQVTIEEPSGDDLAHAQASIQTIACDASPHMFAVTAVASDAPFSAGAGVAIVNATACGIDPASFQFVCQGGGTKVIQVTVR